MVWTNMTAPRLFLLLILITNFSKFGSGRTLDEQFDIISSRSKRYLTYTRGSAIGMFLAFAVPVELENRDVLFSYNFEANYNLPTELAQYDLRPPQRNLYTYFNRTYIYDLIQKRLFNLGYEGRECLLRTICEASRAPVDHNGIMGHFLHVIFTPSTSADEGLNKEQEAETHGREHTADCDHLYPCPFDLLEFISHYD